MLSSYLTPIRIFSNPEVQLFSRQYAVIALRPVSSLCCPHPLMSCLRVFPSALYGSRWVLSRSTTQICHSPAVIANASRSMANHG